MKTENLTGKVVSSLAMAGGAMASRVVADGAGTIIKNPKLKHGAIAAIAVVGAALLDRKTSIGAFTQDIAIGVSATQIGYLAKEIIAPEKEGTIKTALGTPYEYRGYDFLASPRDYDFIPAPEVHTEYEEQPREIVFR